MRDSMRREQALFEAHPDALARVGFEGSISGVNKALEELTRRPREGLIGAELSSCFGDPGSARDLLRQARDRGTVRDYELELRRGDGVTVPVSCDAAIYRTPDGEEESILTSLRDITRRKRMEEALRESEQRFKSSFEDAPIGMALVGTDGRWLQVNRALCRIVGYPEERLLQKTFQDVTHPDDLQADLVHARRLLAGEIRTYQMEKRYLHGLGHEVRVLLSVSLVRGEEGGEPLYFISQIQDITQRKKAEETLRRSEERFSSLVRNALDVIAILDADGIIRYLSPAVERVLGYRPEELVGKGALEYVHPDDTVRVRRELAETLDGPETGPLVEFRFRHADGSWRHLAASANDRLGDPSVEGIVVNARDVTERKVLEERLVHQAFHDHLTGLPNRALFLDRIEHALARAARRRSPTAVLVLDLDDFKVINDSLGHGAGDRLLVGVAGRLRRCLRVEDTLARLGGDEFGILLEDVWGEDGATRVAERIAERLREPVMLGGHEAVVTTSVGIAFGASGEERPEDLLRQADMAMYEAKNRGKAHHKVFEPRMDALGLERLRTGTDLRRAVEREEFRVLYQPKVLLETGEIVGAEALLRWEHPERGLIPPARFIPVAEESGLILTIGRWVLGEACRQAHQWRRPDGSPLTMCVNLSAKQFEHPDLAQDVARILHETGLAPRMLHLEITESVVMEDAQSTIGTLRELRALGINLAVDDFGTGYSSLSYLKRFPIDTLKIDRSFIDGLGEDSEDTVLVSGIIRLAHALNLKVVAEGVESAGQLARLREMGCDFAQGYYFARPLSSKEVAGLLADESPTEQ